MRLTRTKAGGESLWFWCGGCNTHHRYVVKLGTGETGPCWTWNGDLKKTTCTPSLLCNGHAKPEDLHPHTTSHRCHLFLTDGMVRYLGDCTHGLAGKTVPVEMERFGE